MTVSYLLGKLHSDTLILWYYDDAGFQTWYNDCVIGLLGLESQQ